MKRKVEIYGQIKDGKLVVNQYEVSKAIKDWSDCQVRQTIEQIYNKRTGQQNKYYWGVVIHYFCEGYYDTTGERITPSESHEFLKGRFNTKQVVSITGEIIDFPKSTTKNDTVQFMEYQEKCIKFIAEFFGIVCPDPENNEK